MFKQSGELRAQFSGLPLQTDQSDCGVFMLEYMIRAFQGFQAFLSRIEDDT
jgi:hypothetical protein